MPQSYPFWLGGIGASMAACFTHPLDLTKVRMQTVEVAGTKPSMIATIRTSYRNNGLRSLYVGLSASILRQMSYSLVRIGTYEEFKKRLQKRGEVSAGTLLLASSVAGGIGGVAGNPADVILVRMTSDVLRPPEKQYKYGNAIAGLLSLIKEEGVRGLARGIGTNTTRAVLMNTAQVGSYDFFKNSLLKTRVPILDYQFKDNFFLHVAASLAAGTCGTTVTSPVDVIRTRIMGSNLKASPFRVFVKSLREEGILFMFKGWTPAFMRLGPNTVLMFVFYEQLKRAWSASFH